MQRLKQKTHHALVFVLALVLLVTMTTPALAAVPQYKGKGTTITYKKKDGSNDVVYLARTGYGVYTAKRGYAFQWTKATNRSVGAGSLRAKVWLSCAQGSKVGINTNTTTYAKDKPIEARADIDTGTKNAAYFSSYGSGTIKDPMNLNTTEVFTKGAKMNM